MTANNKLESHQNDYDGHKRKYLLFRMQHRVNIIKHTKKTSAIAVPKLVCGNISGKTNLRKKEKSDSHM